MNSCSFIKDICLIEATLSDKDKHLQLFNSDFFSSPSLNQREQKIPQIDLKELRKTIDSPLKKRMSELSLGICCALNEGPLVNITAKDEIYLFTAFAEIETTRKIIDAITINKENLVSPTLFHNSVHNTPLGYFTIINKLHNYTTTISDGLSTNSSFIDFIEYNTKSQSEFVVAAGEEASQFYKLDKTMDIQIQPAFIAYKIVTNSQKGFIYRGKTNSLTKIFTDELFDKSEYIFVDKKVFLEIHTRTENNIITEKKIICDYPFLKDNPTAIAFRLALPFYFNIQSPALVIEKIGEIYHYFEISL